MMTLRPGQSTSDQVENEHPRCEQWLYVIRGVGRATVGKQSVALKTGSLLLIENGEPHRITNYLTETARLAHLWYHKHHVLGEAEEIMKARPALARAAQIVIRNALGILGINAPERM